jgi:hypothetical protein
VNVEARCIEVGDHGFGRQEVPIHLDVMSEKFADMVYVAGGESGPIDVERNQQPTTGRQRPRKLGKRSHPFRVCEMDDRVQRDHAAEGMVRKG